MFTLPTYLVLDLPSEIAQEVRVLRSLYDPFEAQLPPEITIAGSSGIGTIAASQNADEVFRAVEEVGNKLLPFTSAFVSVEQFPGVQIFWLKPRDRAPFDALQRGLLDAGIQFNSNPFPFNPHCTISATVELSMSQERELRSMKVPIREFALVKLCAYQLIDGRAVLLRSFAFGDQSFD